MPTFIKPGFWEKKQKGYDHWLNLDQLITSLSPPAASSPLEYNANATGIQPVLGTNNASGVYSTIGGGTNNTALNGYSAVCGGNIPNTIGGGRLNYIGTNNLTSWYAGANTISGGTCNRIETSNYNGNQTISGGFCNNINSSVSSTIGGGYCNAITNGYGSTIGGGDNNIGSCSTTTISGGTANTSSGFFSTIGGGGVNTASGSISTIGGGNNNTASGCFSFVGGGFLNVSSGIHSTIGSGKSNTSSGSYTGILGGKNNTTNAYDRAFIVGSDITANRNYATFVNQLSVMNMPTSSAGLPTGAVWRNGTVLEIIP